jgi:hypothetical protein
VLEVYGPTHPFNDRGAWAVAAFFDAQTPRQIRNLTQFRGFNDARANGDNAEEAASDDEAFPSRAPVFVPGCSVGDRLLCPVAAFADLVRRRARPECVAPASLQAFLLASAPSAGSSASAAASPGDAATFEDGPIWRLGGVAAVLSVGLNLAVCAAWWAQRGRPARYSPLGRRRKNCGGNSAPGCSSQSDSSSGDEGNGDPRSLEFERGTR